MPECIKSCKFYQFADDSLLLKYIYNENDVNLMQTELNHVFNWSLKNNLILNPNKSIHLRFYSKKIVNLNDYKLNNITIETKLNHKHLGLIIDNKLFFNDHTESIVNKSLQKWAILKRICSNADSNVLLRLYKTYIMPIIEYSNFCWVPNGGQIDKIESVQRQITKFICNKLMLYSINYKERLLKLNLKPLQLRREILCLRHAYNCIHNRNCVPLNWREKFKIKETRNGPLLEVPFSRISLCDHNFFIFSINLFNSLPKEIRSCNTLSSFIKESEYYLYPRLRCF